MVQSRPTSLNLLEPHHRRDSKACRLLSHEFGVVRLYRTFSNYIFTGETRCAGCLCTSSRREGGRGREGERERGDQSVGYLYTSSGWFNHSEPTRTFFSAEKTKSVEVFHMNSGWFDFTEPSLTTYTYTYT